jgi:hypothetical protein
MKSSFRLTFALAAGLVALPVFAAVDPAADARAYHDAGISKVQAQLARAAASAKHASAQKRGKAQGTNVYPGTPLANEFRAYPPSCAAWPLPDKASGPASQIFSTRMPLYTRNANGQQVTTPETVTITIWRIACSSSGSETPYNLDGGFNAMTLLRIDRDAANDGDGNVYPTFPVLQVQQGGIGYANPASLVRAASEPNTFIADGPYDGPIFNSTTYVLENYNVGADYQHLYSYAFKLRIDPVMVGVSPVEFTLPDYSPTQSTYPDAFAPLPLDGYAAAQWINTTLNEGLLIQVTEQPQSDGSIVRQMVFDLLTQDNNGDPLWLVGNAAFPVGQTSLPMDLIYLGNGLSHNPWGHATVSVRDCNTLEVTFDANSGLPASIPAFDGLTEYQRIFSANGMVCE